MYKASRVLPSLSPEQLDDYLARGWFRMEQTVFTTQFIHEDKFVFRDAIWLRYRLQDFSFPKWYLKMRATIPFRIVISKMPPSAEHESLYQLYRETKPQGWPLSLESILFGERSTNIFPTSIVNIFDSDKLIAAGFFDVGKVSAAGIVNFYNPAYSKYRLGKFLFLLKIEQAINTGMQYFYPGYFVPGNRHFDYKLEFDPASLECFLMASNTWIPYRPLTEDDLPLKQIEKGLATLLTAFYNNHVSAYLLYNINFAAVDTSRHDSPYTIFVPATEKNPWKYLVTFDPNTRHFLIFNCNYLDDEQYLVESDGKMICLQFLNFRHPLAAVSETNDVIRQIVELNRKFNELK